MRTSCRESQARSAQLGHDDLGLFQLLHGPQRPEERDVHRHQQPGGYFRHRHLLHSGPGCRNMGESARAPVMYIVYVSFIFH